MGEKSDNGIAGLPSAPAAERNKGPILAVLLKHLPVNGLVLEVACGTGQHACNFAAGLPRLEWQPSDPDPGAVDTTGARVAHAALPNLRPPLRLDVRDRPWPVASFDALVCINLLHIAPWAATEGLFAGAATGLTTRGVIVVYGPFRRDGNHTAPSNASFDRQLRARDPAWGVRDMEAVDAVAQSNGFTLAAIEPMPANNFCLVWRRDGG
ncbi:DUF938 domain-containing protein [Ectothiorhodospiraceae bacterium WFHF3C12]|nr:DUF938 domain-containing protein [Ectothiorhodospiraceae bacterium WFHF3C12]